MAVIITIEELARFTDNNHFQLLLKEDRHGALDLYELSDTATAADTYVYVTLESLEAIVSYLKTREKRRV